MHLRDIVLSTQRIWESSSGERRAEIERFQRATYCVTDLFLKLLGKRLQTKGVAKLVVELDDKVAVPDKKTILRGGPIWIFRWPFALTAREGENPHDLKRFILDLLHGSLVWIANLEGWSPGIIGETCRSAKEAGLMNQGFLFRGKTFPNPSRTLGVRFFFDFDVDAIAITAVVAQKGGEIGRKVLFKDKPFDFPLPWFSGSVDWLSENKLSLTSKDGSLAWSYEIEAEQNDGPSD